MGVTTLVLGPFLAIGISSHGTAATPGHPAAAPATAVVADNHLHSTIPEVAEPTPSPVPSPVIVNFKAQATATPTPRPRAPQVNYPPGTVQAIIMAAAAKYGVDGNWMIRIGECESGLRPNAVSSNGLYFGIFQFLQSTFKAHGGTNIFDPTQQANITANMLAHGQASSWPVCSKR